MNVVFKHFPLTSHKRAPEASRLAVLAQEYGKFWEVHDAIFENLRALDDENLVKIGTGHGIPEDRIRKALAEKQFEDRIFGDKKQGQGFQVNSTPTTFVNGKRVKGAKSLEDFKKIIDQELGGS